MEKHNGLKWWFALATLVFVAGLASFCQTEHKEDSESNNAHAFWGHGDSVHYVGIETCKSCHADVYETFIQTGMGQSYDHAHPQKSKASFSKHPPVYDADLDYFYQAYWHNDSLFIREYRLNETGDTTHAVKQFIKDVIGSGQHTNSHIFSINNHYFQAPITWYVQKDIPDLPPGYEHGANSRFSRIIGLECMSCHNAMPTEFVKGSENKFTSVPKGIDCERCHGPGSAHVAKIQRGEITDTATNPDYSIVNPKRLSAQLRFELCSRCHLQGNAVLKEGKSFFDFIPGMHLHDVMDVYAPRYQNDSSSFIMASHVDRFKMSKCYQSSPEEYVCTSCHNPHVSVKLTGSEAFNTTCTSCHNKQNDMCSESNDVRNEYNNNCVGCHMPSSGSSDIPHVFVHDHNVRKDYSDTIIDDKVQKVFAGLVAINNPSPDLRSRINSYLQQYERFNAWPFLLDSAFHLLNEAGKDQLPHEWVHYYFLKTNFRAVINHQKSFYPNALNVLRSQSYDNRDAWTAYRIAESFNQDRQLVKAEEYISRAVSLAPQHPDFLQKAAVIAIKLQRYSDAEQLYSSLVNLKPFDPVIWNNVGYLHQLQRHNDEALSAYRKAINVDPDYLPAYVKIASIYVQRSDYNNAIHILEKAQLIDPNNTEIIQQLNYLKQTQRK